MLQFSSHPPLDATRYAITLLRTPTKGKLHLIVTCPEMLGCWTHFFAGRTMPCTGDGCDACGHQASSRWHAYLCALDPDTNEHVLFECTAPAAETFAVYRAKHGSLRGCEFLAQRITARANARVCIRTKPADLTKIDLPLTINLQAALCHLWGIPMTETDIILQGANLSGIEHHGHGLPPDPGNGAAAVRILQGTETIPKTN